MDAEPDSFPHWSVASVVNEMGVDLLFLVHLLLLVEINLQEEKGARITDVSRASRDGLKLQSGPYKVKIKFLTGARSTGL